MSSFGDIACVLDLVCRKSIGLPMPEQLLIKIVRRSRQRVKKKRHQVPPKEIPIEAPLRKRHTKAIVKKKDKGPIRKWKLKGERRRKGRF